LRDRPRRYLLVSVGTIFRTDNIATELQLGDILIKALGHVHFQELRARIDVKELSGELIKA
jgi:hypothetical protein